MSTDGSRSTFFRQSGWMALAAIGGGVFNMASNFVAQRMPQGQFNIFDTALSAITIVTIPALGMQASFAAQAAGADNDRQRAELAATMRGALAVLGALWIALAGWWLFRRDQIMADYKLSEPAMLWLLLLISLVTLLSPVPSGVLQGRQDFLWFGAATLLNGAGRLLVLLAVVRGLRWGALGGLAGVLAGSLVVLAVVAWRTRDALAAPPSSFPWRAWLKRLLPVTVGLGALMFIMQADALTVRERLVPTLSSDEADGYSAVRKIAQAMVFLIGAVTSVMYPKVARSFQRAERTDVLALTVLLTGGVGVLGATMASLFPELPLRVLSPDRLIASKGLVAAYCWALIPIAMSNVLVWSLLARECYRAVPWLAAVALADWITLQFFHQRLTTVIGITAIFGGVFMSTCALFLWLGRHRDPAAAADPRTNSPARVSS